jgi:hypothetical protein
VSEVKEFIKQIEAFLVSWVLEEAEDEYSDFLSLLMGWMLCPNIRGWPDYDDWSGPPLQHSEEARTCRLWKVLAYLQNIIHMHRPSKAVAFLEILKWACRLQDVVAGLSAQGENQSWLNFLNVPSSV